MFSNFLLFQLSRRSKFEEEKKNKADNKRNIIMKDKLAVFKDQSRNAATRPVNTPNHAHINLNSSVIYLGIIKILLVF